MEIKVVKPNKGDLVPGHKVYVFFHDDTPALPGKIVAASESGHSVTMDVGLMFNCMGLPRKTEFTWRRSAGSYQQKGTPTKPECGLALQTSK